MKNIKLIGLVVCILLICLIFLSSANDNNENHDVNNGTKVEVNKENVEEVINNGGGVLQYNGYVYYVKATNSELEGFNNKICRKNIKDNKEEILYDASKYKIGERLIIFNNNIFFNMIGQTYYINLENPISINDYNKGILYTIGDGKLIYAHNDTILKGTYYEKTLGINTSSPIATIIPNYMFEDDENLYFYSNNQDNSKSIVAVNKELQTAEILDRVYGVENYNLDILNFKQTENYIYLFLKSDKYELRSIKKDETRIEYISLENKPTEIIYTYKDNLYFKLEQDSKLYEYNPNVNKIAEGKMPLKASDLYTLKESNKNIVLYKNEEELVTILKGTDKVLDNTVIEEVKDYLYIKFNLINNNQNEIMFWKIDKTGNGLEKLN